ncbi:MAG TPA: hypothetical protein VJJ48_02640 [Candidatus Paceibacterota bacterium]
MADMRQENARDPHQLERMKELEEKELCFFCDKNYLAVGASPALFETTWWFVKESDYPYEGTVRHILIASHAHITRIAELLPEAWMNLKKVLDLVEKSVDAPGSSIFVRQGDMDYTAATLDHLHFHFILGGRDKNGAQPIKVKLGYEQEK